MLQINSCVSCKADVYLKKGGGYQWIYALTKKIQGFNYMTSLNYKVQRGFHNRVLPQNLTVDTRKDSLFLKEITVLRITAAVDVTILC